MAKYINADELQAKINGISDYLDALSQLELVCDAIAEAPTADVREVKHGEWIQNDNGTWSCNRCHSWIPNEQHEYARYCLCCGADMRGDEWSIDSLMTQHKENYAKAGCEPFKRTDYDPFK